MRASILKLATKISLECGTYTGVTPNDPEYKILDPVITDEMAEIAMGLKVRKYVSAADVAKEQLQEKVDNAKQQKKKKKDAWAELLK